MPTVKRTTFRPEVDGYAFRNNWSFDAEEKQVLHTLVTDGLDVLEAALSPIIMALLGPAIIAEAALCGPFAPICIGETISAINEGIVSDITGAIEAQGVRPLRRDGVLVARLLAQELDRPARRGQERPA